MSDKHWKLGDELEANGQRYVATSRYPAGISYPCIIWTPIPEGMTAEDLGRRFRRAFVSNPLRDEDGQVQELPSRRLLAWAESEQ